MDFTYWKTVAETVASVLTSGALLIGGYWAYRKLIVQGEHEESLAVSVTARVLVPDQPKFRILEIRCELKNTGKVPCQIDLERSTVTVSTVVVDPIQDKLIWKAVPYYSGAMGEPGTLFNVPVGASMDRVHFVGVPHPGLYGVRVLLAQTEKSARAFYRRMGKPFPTDWIKPELAPAWDDSVIVSTTSDSGKEVVRLP